MCRKQETVLYCGSCERAWLGTGKERRENAQADGNGEEPLSRRRVLRTAVNLFPERKVVVCATVQFASERDACYPMEHEIRALRADGSVEVGATGRVGHRRIVGDRDARRGRTG